MMTREDWLDQAIRKITPIFTETGIQLPANMRSICAVYEYGKRPKMIGQCVPLRCTKTMHILISPALTAPCEIAGIIVHELVHAALNCEHGHQKPFQDLASKVGLKEPWPCASPGDTLTKRLQDLAGTLGSYPAGDQMVFIQTDLAKLTEVLACYRVVKEPPPKPKLPEAYNVAYPFVLLRKQPGSSYGTARILIENAYQYHELLEVDDLTHGEWKIEPATFGDLGVIHFDAYYAHLNRQCFPKMLFHPTLGMKTVRNRGEQKMLGPEWKEKP